ncbi:MAG: cobalt ABC transporter ATP-binding protein [Desulfuromonadales bacterium C00003107]|nr:MAG: cobalt ABC transporter ATP-binding protein [Desulfuromonadales bacterium C00003107]
MSAGEVVTIKDLQFRYRGEKEWALDGITLDIPKGEFLVVMGASEAGKSTLATCLNGLIPHYMRGRLNGDVIVLGQNTKESTVPQLAEDVGIVFQDFEAQLFSTNVELEVAFGPENFGVSREEMKRRIDENLKYVGLEEFRNRPPFTLSGGQKQKLAIASVLAMQPKILVMDEPTTDLDPISKQGIFEIINKLRQSDDRTLIVVEHETEETLDADRIVLIQDGKIVKSGPVREILQDVESLEELGVMPLGIPKFFNSVNPSSQLPLTPEEGVEAFKQANLQISDKKYKELVLEEEETAGKFSTPVIQCTDLEHTYPNGVNALQGIDLEINLGEMVAIIGQNGSGKTTLAKHFNGLLMPTGGDIRVNDIPTSDQGIFKLGQRVGYVFQNPDHQIFSEFVFDEVAFSPRLRNVPEDEVKERVSEALEAVGLVGYEQEDPFSLTKSGRQRVAVAAVLAIQPDVLILDEPTTGLDYKEQRSMMDMVKRLNERGSTTIFITHHMWVVAEYAQKVFVIKDGKILLKGSTREVFSYEELLEESFLRPPHFVQLANRLGKTFLTPSEMSACLETGGKA